VRSWRQANELHATLVTLYELDHEQELTGIAVPVLDACIADLKTALVEGDPVLAPIKDVISVEAIEAGDPIRVADALFVVAALRSRLPNASASSAALLRAQRL
jgi:hypothetical protein